MHVRVQVAEAGHNMTGVLLIRSLPALHGLIKFNCCLIVWAAMLDPDMFDTHLEFLCTLTESITASTSVVSSEMQYTKDVQ